MKAVLTIQEGFANSIMTTLDDADTEEVDESADGMGDKLVVMFSGIPEGVTVMVPTTVRQMLAI